MAIIDKDPYKVTITPRKSENGWWEYTFSFYYQDKPLFNPEITRGNEFVADEYPDWSLLELLENLSKCTEDEKEFGWSAWEEEIMIEVETFMKNIDQGRDGGFNLTIFIDEMFFKDGVQTHGFPVPGLRLFLNRNDLKKLFDDLKTEMEKLTKE